ncbi:MULTISPECIES: hypothetical protein [unclassified Rhodococcus (in: high G+C Gram-positive bacteria)]|uniref:hypothetical protein n=1 Tax=Rhodococcus sp. SJ-3 TaxID=3454628 RepID=UPI003F78C486
MASARGLWPLIERCSAARRTHSTGRLTNQALTDGIEISEYERATIKLAEPFAALAPTPGFHRCQVF